MMLRVPYPTAAHEVQMVRTRLEELTIAPVADAQTIVRIRQLASQVHVDDKIHQYIVAIGQATRNSHPGALPIVKQMLQYGISPRAYHHLLAMARATLHAVAISSAPDGRRIARWMPTGSYGRSARRSKVSRLTRSWPKSCAYPIHSRR